MADISKLEEQENLLFEYLEDVFHDIEWYYLGDISGKALL